MMNLPDVRKAFGIFALAFSFRAPRSLEEWIEAGNLVFSDNKGKGGVFDLQARPYHRGLCRAYHRYSYMCLVMGAQVGKTAFGLACLGYWIDEDPATAMVGFPDRALAGRRSRNEFIPTLMSSPGTAGHVAPGKDSMATMEYKFDRMAVMLVYAGSSSALSAESARYLWADEAAKWKQRDKLEADPVALLWRRGTDWGPLARRLITTTPNYPWAHGWAEFLAGTQHRFWVPCPHCGKPEDVADVDVMEVDRDEAELSERLIAAGYQVLQWRAGADGLAGITGWGDVRDPDEVERLAGYKCAHCGELFGDAERTRALRDGKWVGRYPNRQWFSCQLPSWYSPNVTFGQVARRFYEAQGKLSELQDWTNADCAEPWEEQAGEWDELSIKAHCRDYAAGTIPFRPLAVVLTVDLRAPEIHYEIGAHGLSRSYAMIQAGKLPRVRRKLADGTMSSGLDVLDDVRRRRFPCVDGREYGVGSTWIDAGWEPDEVYRYARGRENVFGLKGQENQQALVNYSYPEKKLQADGKQRGDTEGLLLVQFQANAMKSAWWARWTVNLEDPGAVWLPVQIPDEYAAQLVNEYKKNVASRWGRPKYVWVTKGPNHFKDVSYYQGVAAYVLELDQLTFDADEAEEASVEAVARAADFSKATAWVRGEK